MSRSDETFVYVHIGGLSWELLQRYPFMKRLTHRQPLPEEWGNCDDERNGQFDSTALFGHLRDASVPYHRSYDELTEIDNILSLWEDLQSRRIRFVYVNLPDLAKVVGKYGIQSGKVIAKLRWYDEQLLLLERLGERIGRRMRLRAFGTLRLIPSREKATAASTPPAFLSDLPPTQPLDSIGGVVHLALAELVPDSNQQIAGARSTRLSVAQNLTASALTPENGRTACSS